MQARKPVTAFQGRKSRYAPHLSPLLAALGEAGVDPHSTSFRNLSQDFRTRGGTFSALLEPSKRNGGPKPAVESEYALLPTQNFPVTVMKRNRPSVS